ncbi:MAG: class Ib ribonucleoside-diphosphate reductase assembly flavoprotein NrdI [Comamonas sp.]|nr:class Ib ribonucleoside-diphosphate reductase assembly flavoprotein NrdI [Comamonas sp.]
MTAWVYYSSKTGNTARLMQQAGLRALRIPTQVDAPMPEITQPFVLVTPSFGDSSGKGAVPKAVIRFLNAPERRQWLRAVVACGDRNFGTGFAQAGDVIARKCQVPLLHRVEMAGVSSDWARLQAIDQTLSSTLLNRQVTA